LRQERAREGQVVLRAVPQRRDLAARFEGKLAEHVAFEERTLFPAAQEQVGCDRMAALRDELSRRRL
jgi:hemerythrin-like domain-containing protein